MKLKFLLEKVLKLGKNVIIVDVYFGYEIVMVKEGFYFFRVFYDVVRNLKNII